MRGEKGSGDGGLGWGGGKEGMDGTLGAMCNRVGTLLVVGRELGEGVT